MSVLHLAAKFGQLKVIDMLWDMTPIDRVSVKVWTGGYLRVFLNTRRLKLDIRLIILQAIAANK